MKRNRFKIGVFCAVAVCLLSGCQLAKENAGAGAFALDDRLIGVYVTAEHLDLFDFAAYLEDNLKGFSGGEVILDGDEQGYQGRIYAVLRPRTLTNEETGETAITHEYVFEGVEGIPFFSPTVPASEGNESFVATMSGDAISDGNKRIFVGDDENSITLEGTIYVSASGDNHTFYFNPVYQSADGSVYLVSGSGMSSSGDHVGATMSQTLDAVQTVTENGVSRTDRTSTTISITFIHAPEKFVVLEMDAGNSVLSRAEFSPGGMPDEFAPEAGTAYLIMEIHSRDTEGKQTISREIFGRDAGSIEAFYVRDDGICLKRQTVIMW